MLVDVNWLAWKIVFCTAYAYNRSGCMIWEGALLNLLQLPYSGEIGQDIYFRLAADEYQSSKSRMSEMKCMTELILNYVIFCFELIILDSLLWLS
jgi:hypothetical protein